MQGSNREVREINEGWLCRIDRIYEPKFAPTHTITARSLCANWHICFAKCEVLHR